MKLVISIEIKRTPKKKKNSVEQKPKPSDSKNCITIINQR